jgi:hypothetical protein
MLRSLLLEATLAKLPAEAQITVVATAEVVATVEAVVFAVSVMPVAMDEAIVATVAVIGVRLGATPGRMGVARPPKESVSMSHGLCPYASLSFPFRPAPTSPLTSRRCENSRVGGRR